MKEPPRTKAGVFDGYGPNVPLPAVVLSWQGAAASDPDAPALKVLRVGLAVGWMRFSSVAGAIVGKAMSDHLQRGVPYVK